jgi:hypothetical protein
MHKSAKALKKYNFIHALCLFMGLYTAASFQELRAQSCANVDGLNYCSSTGATCGEPTEGSPPSAASPNGYTGAWGQGVTVQVNINTTGLTGDQVSAISQAYTNWNGVGGVNFNVQTSSVDAPTGINTYNVRYGSTDPTAFTGDNILAGAHSPTDANTSTGHVETVTTEINPARVSTCLECFTKLMSHEIAHSFGLNDSRTNQNSAIQDLCALANNYPSTCGSEMPTPADIAAVMCVTGYTYNSQCDPTAGCSGGLTCESNSTCGCGDPCDDSRCPGYDVSCGTGTYCQNDYDCGGGFVCVSGQCGCSDSCDDPSCPGWTASCATGSACAANDDCPGGLVCVSGSCGCSDSCDDPSCPGWTSYCGNGGGCTSDNDCPGGLVCMSGSCGCGNSCDDSSCPGYDAQSCSCTDVCNAACSNYDPNQCNGGGGNGGGGGPSDGGGNCPSGCFACGEFEDCYDWGEMKMPEVFRRWLPVGVSLALVLPFMIDIRRRPGKDLT